MRLGIIIRLWVSKMADKLFPTPEATVQFQMPNENKDLLDLMDNMIKMGIQQQNMYANKVVYPLPESQTKKRNIY